MFSHAYASSNQMLSRTRVSPLHSTLQGQLRTSEWKRASRQVEFASDSAPPRALCDDQPAGRHGARLHLFWRSCNQKIRWWESRLAARTTLPECGTF